MPNKAKFFLVTGFLCLAIGLVGAAVSFQSLDLETGVSNMDMEKKISASAIDTLTIQNNLTGVTFVPSNTDEITVHVTGSAREEEVQSCTIEAVTEGTNGWRVDVCPKKKNHIDIGFDLTELKRLISGQDFKLRTEVALPDKLYKAITVSTDTGAISFKDVNAEKLTASTDTGSITIDRFEGKTLSLQTDTGSIHLNDGQGNMKLRTDTGSITASLRELGDSVNLDSDTGSIRVELNTPPTDASFDLRTDTGSANLQIPGMSIQKTSHNEAKGTIGNGSKKLTARADTGYIEVKSR
ncbi:DUF4097 family beta strand repeat-containing protein [Paenibacillus roseipurpureus]|uniref:DUF4097 family beta strand repeat-containing protein n=1 Tax=Paenibacillus roseopurpureus TaxID=2918901 RepID=A0AA96LPA1_9BACL|nr:DUF4097 family beta strand repeat-containing protein [Paenibacillus sp. MBLB1832]WNR44714.1 DUF4097 family beta strand repeat-containing protein [Paenibacillus sp. MBLB1832]